MGPVNRDGFWIAIDGGGTTTDGVAFSSHGRLLAAATRGPSNPQSTGADAAVELVAGLVDHLAHVSDQQLLGVGAYLSGLDFPHHLTLFRDRLLARPLTSGPWPDVTVENDILALLRAGTDAATAVAVVCGTGINAIGVRADGARVRYPAVGEISGDWGGGLQLGREALWHAARDEDERGPATTLTVGIERVFGVADILELVMRLDSRELPLTELAVLSPLVLQHARDGDRVATDLVDRLGDEVALFATTTLRRLGLLDEAVPVILGGGVLTARDSLLLDRVEREISASAPRATIRVVDEPPILGAALLTLGDRDHRAASALRAGIAERYRS